MEKSENQFFFFQTMLTLHNIFGTYFTPDTHVYVTVTVIVYAIESERWSYKNK